MSINDLEYIVDVSYASKVISFEAALQEARHFNEYAYKSVRCIFQDQAWQYDDWPPAYAKEHLNERDPSYIDRDPLPSLEYGHGIMILPPLDVQTGNYGMHFYTIEDDNKGAEPTVRTTNILAIDNDSKDKYPTVLRVAARFEGVPDFPPELPYLIAQWDLDKDVIYRRTRGTGLAAYRVPRSKNAFALVPYEHKWLYAALNDESTDGYIHLRPREWPPPGLTGEEQGQVLDSIGDISLNPEEKTGDQQGQFPTRIFDYYVPGSFDSPLPSPVGSNPPSPISQSAIDFAEGVFN